MQKSSYGKFRMALVSLSSLLHLLLPTTTTAIEKKLSSPPFLKQALQIWEENIFFVL